MKASQAHDETVVEMLKAGPEMADVYLATALEEVHLPGGQFARLAALLHIAEAQGMANVAQKAGMPRESLLGAPPRPCGAERQGHCFRCEYPDAATDCGS